MINITGYYNPQYPCDLNTTGWQRCADDNGADSGGTYGAGRSLQKVGTYGRDDLVGFKGLTSGYRGTDGSFYSLGSSLYLWSSTPASASSAWRRYMIYSYSTIYRYPNLMAYGFSVRCLRDTDDTSDFTDPRDGTVYPCVKIGNQVWMTKNLAYLPSVNAAADGSESVAKYYVYDYDGTDVATAKALANYTEHGVLYNYPAAIISAPDGFHVPSDEELNVLELATLEVVAETAGDGLMTILNDGNVGIGTTNPSEKLDVNGNIKATQFKLSDLNTAPSSSSDTGTKGEIRVTADAIYICSATDTWVKADLATF